MNESFGCSCHIAPPCSFCESLTEEEAQIFAAGGADAVLRHRIESDQAQQQVAELHAQF